MAKETVYVKKTLPDPDTGELSEQFVQVDLEDLIKESWRSPGVGKAILDRRGHEVVNPIPVAPPVGYKREPSLAEQIRLMVRQEREALLDLEPESLEESDDFEIEDDPAPASRWENDAEPSIKELRRRALEAGYVYNRSTGQYELPPAPEPAQEPELPLTPGKKAPGKKPAPKATQTAQEPLPDNET